jgi:PIN domain nuclease of toxin-antitoxin system
MKILIDTHILIWYTEADAALSSTMVSIIENPENSIYISVTSFYEIAIKIKIGKLSVNKNFEDLYKQTTDAKIEILPISQNELTQYLNVPLHPQHKDPFDRLIIATALANNLTLLSADKNFELYKDLIEIVY